jgi:hypothetical protein
MIPRSAVQAVLVTSVITLMASGCAPIKVVPRECNERFAAWATGPEDVEFDDRSPGGPRLIVSAQERRVLNRDGSFHYEGQLLSIPLTGPERGYARPFTLEGRDLVPFHPHGIFLLRTAGPRRLYVVNHAEKENHRIEVFAVEGDQLAAWPSPPTTRYLPNPNDLVVLPNGEIYVTNRTRHRSRTVQFLEALFRFRSGSVVRYKSGSTGKENDNGWEVVARDIASANGIAVTGDAGRVFVAATLDEGIHVFHRDPASGALTPKPEEFIRLGQGVDNLTWGDDGKTLIAARHPKRLAFLWHAISPDARSPSEIWRIPVDDTSALDAVYGNDGSEISAASIGLVSNGRLYMGQVFDQGILSCRLP